MNKLLAMRVAGLVGGKAFDSGGDIWVVTVWNPKLETALCLGGEGSLQWWVEDEDGEHIIDKETVFDRVSCDGDIPCEEV